MAIYWCDPYIESTNGAIHGYTGAGGKGSYTDPYSLADLENSTYYNAFVSGDELRFKGLAEASFFDAPNSSASTNLDVGRFYFDAADYDKGFKITDVHGATYYGYIPPSGTMAFYNTTNSTSYGAPCSPPANSTYTPMKNAYKLTSTNKKYLLFGSTFPSNIGVTITAGWTSDTVQGGVTFIYGNTVCLNCASTSSITTTKYGAGLDWDCRNTMVVATGYYNISNTFACKNFKFKAFTRTFNTSTAYFSIYDGDFDCGNFSQGFNIIYMVTDTTPCTVNIESHHSHSTASTIYAYNNNSYNSGSNLTVRVNKIYNQGNYFNVYFSSTPRNTDSLTWVFESDYQYVSSGSSRPVRFSGTTYLSKDAFFETFEGNPSTVTSWITNANSLANLNKAEINSYNPTGQFNHFTNTIDYILESFQTKFYLYRSSYAVNDQRGFTKLNNTVELESLEYCLIEEIGTPPPDEHSKFFIIRDSQESRPLQTMSPAGANGNHCFIYDSKEFTGKMTWHFVAECQNLTYKDKFFIPMPSYASNDLNFYANFDSYTFSDMTINIKLYGITKLSAPVLLATVPVTANESNITADVNHTLTSSNLTTNAISQIYAQVECTPTTAAVNKLAFGGMRLTQI